jgi:toxin ParE1/3/4
LLTPFRGMSATYQFVKAAEAEYFDAIRYYAAAASDADVAVRFVAAIEEAVTTICAAPAMWRIVGPPEVRRYVLRHFPYVIYYCYRAEDQVVEIHAVMHTSRKPGYWRSRISGES